MAKLINPNYDSPMQIYEEVPDPPWYQPALDVVTGKTPLLKSGQSDWETLGNLWEGVTRYSTMQPPSSPYDVRPALKIPSTAPVTPAPLEGPAYTPEQTKSLEDSSRLMLEIYAGLMASGLLPAAAVPSALQLMQSGRAMTILRNAGPEALRKALIAAAPAAVDVATGAPEKAAETFGYSLMGEYMGGTPANVARTVGRPIAAHMGPSAEGAVTRRVLEELGVPAPLAAQSKAAWTQRVDESLRSSLGGGPLRRAQSEGTEAITGRLTQPTREWIDDGVSRPPLTTGTAAERYAATSPTRYGETTTLPEPPVTTGRPDLPPEPSLPEEVTGRLGLPRSPSTPRLVEDVTLTRGATVTRTPDEAAQEALKEHQRILGKAESMRYGQIDDVILKQRPDPGGARVPPPRGEPFTMPVDVPTSQVPELPPPPTPSSTVQERRPLWAATEPTWREVPADRPPVPGYVTRRPPEVAQRDPQWKNIPEEPPYDPASTEALYGTGRFKDVPPRERPPVAPEGPSSLVDHRPAKDLARALKGDSNRLKVPGADDLLDQILAMPDRLSFEAMAAVRGDLLSVSRQMDALIPGRAKGYADRLVGAVDQEMATTALAHGKDTYQAWRDANAMTKANAVIFEKPGVKALMGANADQVFGTAATTGSAYAIREAREAINNPLLWQQVQDAWLRKTVGTYTDPLTNQMSGAGLLQYVKQNYKAGALKELLPAGHAEQLVDFATALTQLQRGAESTRGVGRVIHFTPSGGLAFPIVGAYEALRSRGPDDPGLPGWVLPAAGGVTLFALTPMVLSRMMAKPQLMRWAIEGMKVQPSTKRAHEVGGMLLGLLAKEGLLEEQPAEMTTETPQASVPTSP